ncbi:MAG: HAD family hydrolase [Halococcoides sp.]
MIDGPIEAVGFDLDETLIVPDRDRDDLLADACEAVGIDPIDSEAYLAAHDATPADVISRTREPIFERLHPEAADAIADAYCSVMADAVCLVPSARVAIEAVHDRGLAVGICTDGPVRAQRAKLDAVGLSGVADATLITGSIDARKPDPTVYDRLTDRLEVAPANTLFVGDGPENDVAGAAAAGLRAVQVRTDAPIHPEADAVVDRSALDDAIETLLSPTSDKM